MESGVLGDLCGVTGGVAGTMVGPGVSNTGGVTLVGVLGFCFGDSVTLPEEGGRRSVVGT